MSKKQDGLDFAERDYGYVAYFRKATDETPEYGDRFLTGAPHPAVGDISIKEKRVRLTMYHEGLRDYFTPSLRQINHLIQFDQKPNLELMEPKWELYKVSISFELISK